MVGGGGSIVVELVLTSFFTFFQDMKWADDKVADQCQLCKQTFSISRRKVGVSRVDSAVSVSCFGIN